MGEERVKLPTKKSDIQQFVKNVLIDIQTLELMLEKQIFDVDTIRIGAEQEMCLVDQNYKPAMKSLQVLKHTDNKLFTTELALFNLECNINPLEFKGNCLSKLEQDIKKLVSEIRKHAKKENLEIALTGILPSARKYDLELDNITPIPRYFALMDALKKLRGGEIELNIEGFEELRVKHDTPLMEACNTGFQIHLQINPAEFAERYNIAQAIAAPVLAASTFSPLLFGKKLWAETRIALFQQSVDTRMSSEHLRDQSPRVMFGNKWLDNSILEIYREDISRFRVLLQSTLKENSYEKFMTGVVPELASLQVHNGTVYRWNRPCYGVNNNVPHLRIENRVLPSGPTIKDEIVNTAFWLGLMNGMKDAYGDVSKKMKFLEARSNFFEAARTGLDNKFIWMKGKSIPAKDLIIKELIPIAKAGLKKAKIRKNDIDTYLEILKERVKTGKTATMWMLNSFDKLITETTKDEVLTEITANMVENQKMEKPVHTWKLAELGKVKSFNAANLLVEEFMSTDLFTIQKDDIIDLLAEMLDYHKLRYVPVENEDGMLVGLVTSRQLLKWNYKNRNRKSIKPVTISKIMIENLITINPNDNLTKAISLMQQHKIGCIPVVKRNKLVGIITEQDMTKISARLIKKMSFS